MRRSAYVYDPTMVLDVALLGTGGMMPLPNRWLSSVLIRYTRHLILFDCGEGTQISLRSLGWGFGNLDLLLLSHVHGDHITGLPGLLLTLGNAGRTHPLPVLGPSGFRAVAEGLLSVARWLPFTIDYHELAPGQRFDFDGLQVTCAAAEHHVPCLAYRLDVPRARRFLPDRARALGVPMQDWSRLQRGQPAGGVEPEAVLGPPRRGVGLGLVTDTRPIEPLVDLVHGVDLLIAEGMYGSDDDQPRAVERRHMTFRETATLAARAGVGELILTLFSPSVVGREQYRDNAAAVFAASPGGRAPLIRGLRFPDD